MQMILLENCDNYTKDRVTGKQMVRTHVCTLRSQEVVLQNFGCVLL